MIWGVAGGLSSREGILVVSRPEGTRRIKRWDAIYENAPEETHRMFGNSNTTMKMHDFTENLLLK